MNCREAFLFVLKEEEIIRKLMSYALKNKYLSFFCCKNYSGGIDYLKCSQMNAGVELLRVLSASPFPLSNLKCVGLAQLL